MSDKKARTDADVLALTEELLNAEKQEDVVKIYDDWANEYDQDMAVGGVEYRGPKWLTETVSRWLSGHKDARILDVAAGTGLAGELLKKEGFTNLDALDGSAKMLEGATKTKAYQKLIHSFLTSEPTSGIAEDAYEAVMVMGALVENHLHYNCFKELLRITKTGGYIFLGIWDMVMDVYGKELDRLVADGKWAIMEKRTEIKLYGEDDVHMFVMKKSEQIHTIHSQNSVESSSQ